MQNHPQIPFDDDPTSSLPVYPNSQASPRWQVLLNRMRLRTWMSQHPVWAIMGIGGIFLCSLCSVCGIVSATMRTQAPQVSQRVVISPMVPTATLIPTAAQPTITPTTLPSPTTTELPLPPKPTLSQSLDGNPWGYSLSGHTMIYSPPSNFCDYFNCIDTFWNGHGYVMECNDGMYSKSGGRQDSCFHHGGDQQPLYAP